jgi:hypothetical protein
MSAVVELLGSYHVLLFLPITQRTSWRIWNVHVANDDNDSVRWFHCKEPNLRLRNRSWRSMQFSWDRTLFDSFPASWSHTSSVPAIHGRRIQHGISRWSEICDDRRNLEMEKAFGRYRLGKIFESLIQTSAGSEAHDGSGTSLCTVAGSNGLPLQLSTALPDVCYVAKCT